MVHEAKTLFDKLWDAHRVPGIGPAFDDDSALLLIDRILLHERMGSIALKSLADDNRAVLAPRQVFCIIDHIVDTLPGRGDDTAVPGGSEFIRVLRAGAADAGLTLFDIDDDSQGITHVVAPEQGIALPGLTIVCPDSHTCTQGALGALAWGIGSSAAEHVLATGTMHLRRPATMRITCEGSLSAGVTAKDLILDLIAKYGTEGGRGFAVEFAGSAVTALEMDARMTLCNMAVEFGAFTGLIAPDAKTTAYVTGRPYAPTGAALEAALKDWAELISDADATFDREIRLDAASVAGIAPMVTWGTNPGQAVAVDGRVPAPATDTDRAALSYMDIAPGTALTDLAITGAFIGSCTNSRLSDLRRAAAILKGRRVADGVRAICVPGSTKVKHDAEAEGLDKIFTAAGFEWRESGCSMCFYAGGESFGYRQRVITSTNRNFESRQGPETRSHLASPETVAASALAGRIADPRKYIGGNP